MGHFAYLGRWNYKLNKPILGEEWISEDAARQAYGSRTRTFDIVPAAVADGQGGEPRPTPAWVLTAYAKGPVAFTATFVNPAGSVWRVIDYKDEGERLFKWVVTDYTYPDSTTGYRLGECTMLVSGTFNPDGTGSLTINDKSKPTVDRLSMDQVDVSRHWMDRPPFGAWEQLTDAEFGTTPSSWRVARDSVRETSMTSPPADGEFSVRAVRSLVDELLAEEPLVQEWKGEAATILDIGDLEDHLVLAVRKGVVTFETISRNHRHVTAEFGRELDAWSFLIMKLGNSRRSAKRMRDINPRELAPGTTLRRGPSGYWLTWPGGAAIFHRDYDAIHFSWVARAKPADIAASYRHINGEPLFDLGVRFETRLVDPPPPRRVMTPPPVEMPPPDDLDAADLTVIDAVAADLKWARRPATGAEIISLSDGQVGRAISYLQNQFVYEHTVGRDWRKATCTFSTAAGARRFLIAELGSIVRMQKRMPTIRPKLAGPDCSIEKGPTSFLVTSPAGQATFNLGPIGHGHALVFSWVATANLASIAASYRDPHGQPVFTPSCLHPSPTSERPSSAHVTEPAPTGTDIASMVIQDDDPDLSADLAVIDDFLTKSLLWSRRPGVDPLVFDIATFNAEWVLARSDSGYTIEERRSRNVYGTFSSARGARRYAIMEVGRLWRESHGLKPIWPRQLAPGSRLQKLPDGYRLNWNGGEARFRMDYNAIRFSWIATAEPADIAASFSHPNGEPLFDLSRPPRPPAG